MYRCINCGSEVAELYRKYGPNVLKLQKCSSCGLLADKYIEYDPVIIFVDLILLEKQSYRHLLYNCDSRACWKLVIILWLTESFRSLSLCDNNKIDVQSWEPFQYNFHELCNIYLILLETAVTQATFVCTVILATEIVQYFRRNNYNRCSRRHATKALVIGGCGKLLELLEITWGYISLTPHYFLILSYTFLCLLTVYTVVTDNGKLESLCILGIGVAVYNCAFHCFSIILRTSVLL